MVGKSLLGLIVGLALATAPALAAPTAEELRDTIRSYIAWQEDATGAFTIPDRRNYGKLRSLTLIRVHERVGKAGDYYYSCTDMRDVATGEALDLDFDISDQEEVLKVVAIRIHKDDGKPRFTYGENNTLIPVNN